MIIIIYFDRFNPRANKEIKPKKDPLHLPHSLSLSTTAPHPFLSFPPTYNPTPLSSNPTPPPTQPSPSPTPHFTTTPHPIPSHPDFYLKPAFPPRAIHPSIHLFSQSLTRSHNPTRTPPCLPKESPFLTALISLYNYLTLPYLP